uniref:Transmembrane protein 69 n=1 Tax=Saimiri boliviensis boliviensis TaxID=39432 RepID=A0A2K6S5F1_SAIBB
MVRFIRFSQTSSKMLKYSFPVGLRASRTDTLSLKMSLQQNVSLFPRPWLYSSFPVYMSKTQCYHTSPCSFKKKQKATLPSRPPSTISYLPKSPKPALYITVAGLIPFVAPPLVMLMTKTYIPILAFTQIAYGVTFLSFLGGIRWGFALPEGSPAKPNVLNLANTEAIVTIIMGLGIALHLEVFLLPHYPNWFKALRLVVTLVKPGQI